MHTALAANQTIETTQKTKTGTGRLNGPFVQHGVRIAKGEGWSGWLERTMGFKREAR